MKKMVKKVHKLYTEGDCGWLKVKKAKLVNLGIAGKITGNSFMRGDNAYLDTIHDVPVFDQAMKENGFEYGIKTFASKGRSSRIRKYAKFTMLNVPGNATDSDIPVVAIPKKVKKSEVSVGWNESEKLVKSEGMAILVPHD